MANFLIVANGYGSHHYFRKYTISLNCYVIPSYEVQHEDYHLSNPFIYAISYLPQSIFHKPVFVYWNGWFKTTRSRHAYWYYPFTEILGKAKHKLC